MRSMRFFILAVIACLMAFGNPGADKKKKEDANTRTVQGAVLDASDQPVTKAIVQLKDTKTLQVRSFITQQDGRYHFAGLSTNIDYELKAEYNGSASGTKTLSLFDNRKDATINLKLEK